MWLLSWSLGLFSLHAHTGRQLTFTHYLQNRKLAPRVVRFPSVCDKWLAVRCKRFYAQIELTSTRAHPSPIFKIRCSISIVAYNPGVIMWIEIDSDSARFDIWLRWACGLDPKAWSLISRLPDKAPAAPALLLQSRRGECAKFLL